MLLFLVRLLILFIKEVDLLLLDLVIVLRSLSPQLMRRLTLDYYWFGLEILFLWSLL